MALYNLDPAAHATVLAALRDYQNHLVIHGTPPAAVLDIATKFDTVTPLSDEDIDDLCESLNHGGLDFSDVVELEGKDSSDPYVAAAQEHRLLEEGTLEVDPKTIVSESEDGAYVMAWIWVSNGAAGVTPEE